MIVDFRSLFGKYFNNILCLFFCYWYLKLFLGYKIVIGLMNLI